MNFELHLRLHLNGVLWDQVVAANQCHYLSKNARGVKYVRKFAQTVMTQQTGCCIGKAERQKT
eukprot:1167946-Amphidinium_carterae.1